MNEEELAVFDILTRPGPELSTEERAEVKKVVDGITCPRMKELLVLNWRQKAAARSQTAAGHRGDARHGPAAGLHA